MQNLTLAEWSNVAQIVTAIVTLMGVSLALYSSIRSLRELHIDRQQRLRPFLSFESGGTRYPVKFIKRGTRIPGFNPSAVSKYFPDLPKMQNPLT